MWMASNHVWKVFDFWFLSKLSFYQESLRDNDCNEPILMSFDNSIPQNVSEYNLLLGDRDYYYPQSANALNVSSQNVLTFVQICFATMCDNVD